MKLFVCVDDRFGLLFNHRRVSRDVAVINLICQRIGTEKLWMHPYSVPLFPEGTALQAEESFLERAKPEDFCFLENADIRPYIHRVDELILFRWNRKYPFDFSFPFEECFKGWRKISSEDFPGNSHDIITMEVYRP